jgi:hypothetical protein
MSTKVCPTCEGLCCDSDIDDVRCEHDSPTFHWCPDCDAGFVWATHTKSASKPVWTAEDERAAVVAWLRKEAVSHRRDGFPIAAYTMQERADAIERGEHCREEKP